MTERRRVAGFAHGAICGDAHKQARTTRLRNVRTEARVRPSYEQADQNTLVYQARHFSSFSLSHGPVYPEAQKPSAPETPPLQASALWHARIMSLVFVARQ